MASIKEVAALANVSPATVSRVMNGTAKVDEEKKQRVLKAIEETGFVPNEVARSLFKKSAKIIALVLPSIENPFFTQMAGVIERTADAYGYKLLLYNTDDDIEKEKSVLQMLTAMNVDGIILTTSSEGVEEYIERCNIPIVVTDRIYSKDDTNAYVHCDHYKGGRMAAEHLLACGCQNIVCFRGPKDVSSARERYLGYRDVCKERGIKEQMLDCDYNFEAGLKATEELLELYPDADGIVACNDVVAISAYKVLHKKGIVVPQQIQIIGFDDIALAQLMTPEITTIAQPIEQLGVKAAELIIKKEEEQKEYIFEPKLIVRETTMKKIKQQ